MDFAVALALVSLLVATLLSNHLANRREKVQTFDPITHEARELLLRERAAPMPMCPTLGPEHWAWLAAAQPSWRRQVFEAARTRYVEAREAFSRDEIDGELYYPDPGQVAGAAHAVLVLTERY